MKVKPIGKALQEMEEFADKKTRVGHKLTTQDQWSLGVHRLMNAVQNISAKQGKPLDLVVPYDIDSNYKEVKEQGKTYKLNSINPSIVTYDSINQVVEPKDQPPTLLDVMEKDTSAHPGSTNVGYLQVTDQGSPKICLLYTSPSPRDS